MFAAFPHCPDRKVAESFPWGLVGVLWLRPLSSFGVRPLGPRHKDASVEVGRGHVLHSWPSQPFTGSADGCSLACGQQLQTQLSAWAFLAQLNFLGDSSLQSPKGLQPCDFSDKH